MTSEGFTPVGNAQPFVQALIQTDFWNLSTETAGNSSLNVLVGAALILTCFGDYPVRWHSVVGKIPDPLDPQTDNCEGRSNESYKLPIMEQYKATLTIRKFSKADVGLYTCMSTGHPNIVSNTPMGIAVKIGAHTVHRDHSHFQTVQCGFSKVTVYRECYHQTGRTLATCIYAAPNISDIDHTLSTNGHTYNLTRNTTKRLLIKRNLSVYMLFEAKELNAGIGRVTWTVLFIGNPIDNKIQENATLISEYRLKNGSLIENQFEDLEITLSDACVWRNFVDLQTMATRRHMIRGRYHTIDIRWNVGSDESVAVSKHIADSSRFFKCGRERPVCSVAEAVSMCGILGISWRKMTEFTLPRLSNQYWRGEKNQSIYLWLWNASRPLFVEAGQVHQEIMSYTIEVRVSIVPKEPCSLHLGTGGTKKDPLNIVVFDPQIFGNDFDRVQIVTVPENVKSGAVQFIGDLFILRCFVPTCYAGQAKWCKNGDQQCVEFQDPKSNRIANVSYGYRFYDSTNSTIAFDLVFNPLNLPDAGRYQCMVRSPTERWNFLSDSFDLIVDRAAFVYWPIAVGVSVTAVAFGMVMITYWTIKRRMLKKHLRRLARSLKNSELNASVATTHMDHHDGGTWCDGGSYEISIEDLGMGQQLGKGEFGLVRRANLKSVVPREVAVKTPSDHTNIRHFEALVAELKVLNHLTPHVNVLGLVGSCTSRMEQGELYIVVDLCQFGPLREYLIKHKAEFENPRLNTPIQLSQEMLMDYSYQTANGLEHLATQNIIHRDIALRNLLLTDNHIVKVSDFGLSKIAPNIYNKKFLDCDKMPLHWMALESIMNGVYSEESDVWSFGILLWEMFSCGRHPNPDCYDRNTKNKQTAFVRWLQEGNRLHQPRLGHKEIYDLMRQCWNDDAPKRPAFSECKDQIEKLMNTITVDEMHRRMAQEWAEQCKWFQERRQSRMQRDVGEPNHSYDTSGFCDEESTETVASSFPKSSRHQPTEAQSNAALAAISMSTTSNVSIYAVPLMQMDKIEYQNDANDSKDTEFVYASPVG